MRTAIGQEGIKLLLQFVAAAGALASAAPPARSSALRDRRRYPD